MINMAPRDAAPVGIPGVFVGFSTGEAMKAVPGLPVSAGSVYDGWGYLHVINNNQDVLTVPASGIANPGDTMDVPYMHELGYYAPAETVEDMGLGTTFGDLTMHNIEADPLSQGVEPSYTGGPRMFLSWNSLGMRALEYRPGHFHANANNEGSYSQNVHEVGRFIAADGSNFWGVHVDTLESSGEQIILGSDRNTGLWIFTFDCEVQGTIGVFYCDNTAP